VQQGSTNYYAQAIRGAYQAFFDSNIQADFVALEDIGKYKAIYLPYPVMLKHETVDAPLVSPVGEELPISTVQLGGDYYFGVLGGPCQQCLVVLPGDFDNILSTD